MRAVGLHETSIKWPVQHFLIQFTSQKAKRIELYLIILNRFHLLSVMFMKKLFIDLQDSISSVLLKRSTPNKSSQKSCVLYWCYRSCQFFGISGSDLEMISSLSSGDRKHLCGLGSDWVSSPLFSWDPFWDRSFFLMCMTSKRN